MVSLRRVSALMMSALVTGAALMLWDRLFSGWVLDDAYIAFRYSAHLADGVGLRWNPGEDPVEGFTSFLWVILGAAAQYFGGLPPHIAMVTFGVVSWAALGALIVPIMSVSVVSDQDSAAEHRSAGWSLLPVGAVVLNPYLAFHGFHGLETTLHMLVLTSVVGLAIRPTSIANDLMLAAGSLVAVMTRPDAVILLAPLWGIRLAFCRTSLERRPVWLGAGVFVIAVAACGLAKWAWFGYPLPNTFYIKQGPRLPGRGYVAEFLMMLWPLWLFLSFAAGRVGIARMLADRRLVLLLAPALIFCLAYVWPNPILGIAHRFLVPVMPLLLIGCCRACWLCGPRSAARPSSVPLAGLAVAFTAVTSLSGLETYRSFTAPMAISATTSRQSTARSSRLDIG